MELEIRDLRLVQAIAEEGSVTRAGERLHLSQSALSHRLRAVESRLGVALFLRLNKKMVPTPAGERLLVSGRGILEQMRRAEEDLRRTASEREGVLRIAIECYTCYHWLPSLLESFRDRHPRVDVRIAVEETGRPIQALLAGRLDLAVVSDAPRDRRLRLRPLFEDEMVVVVSPDHPLAARPYVRPEDFADQHLYLYSAPEESTTVTRVLVPAGVMPRRVTQAQLTEAIIELVKAGLGIAVMARWAVAPHVAAGTLHALPLTRKGYMRKWIAARLRAASAPGYLTAFEDLLAAHPLGAGQRGGRESAQAGANGPHGGEESGAGATPMR
jgi:LysR family transcriptional regulator for metE and metH